MYVLKQTADTNTVLLHNLIQAIRAKIRRGYQGTLGFKGTLFVAIELRKYRSNVAKFCQNLFTCKEQCQQQKNCFETPRFLNCLL